MPACGSDSEEDAVLSHHRLHSTDTRVTVVIRYSDDIWP